MECIVCAVLCNYIFFNDTATTEIYTLSLHDALPIFPRVAHDAIGQRTLQEPLHPRPPEHPHGDHGLLRELGRGDDVHHPDRKSTRLNSSHANISYAVFCLKKKIDPCMFADRNEMLGW